ncbi:hypothetical protein BJ138DRAFT_1152627 [Hygrophoropsis aurantiaca]|uniref:Uncharacterized protein n=1 Tax=Hygrophoropsis aurantiaca TaxID=72124 RepID=A0ACB8AAX6_9AGAM|nr:hypothetical protein BJ138DRAFT_1152627 [Hygrophoropsis aurantiaca]
MSNSTQAEVEKEKGNTAFQSQDYKSAIEHYTLAISLDPLNFAYPLNRSITNLKLARWDDAERDATKALGLSPNNCKALYRRFRARMMLEDSEGAYQDVSAFRRAGGDTRMSLEMVSELSTLSGLLAMRKAMAGMTS